MARGVGGDYLRDAIIVNISIKGRGDYSREVINRGTAIIRENTVYKELLSPPPGGL